MNAETYIVDDIDADLSLTKRNSTSKLQRQPFDGTYGMQNATELDFFIETYILPHSTSFHVIFFGDSNIGRWLCDFHGLPRLESHHLIP